MSLSSRSVYSFSLLQATQPFLFAPLVTLSFALCSALTCRLLLAGTAKFFLWSFGQHFDLDLPCRGAARGAELLEAVAARLGRRKEEVVLRQYRARRRKDGALLVDVGKNIFSSEYVDEKGRKEENFQADNFHKIADNEEVPEAGPLRALILFSFK